MADLYFCPTSREVECATVGGFDVCCEHPEKHLLMPDTEATHAVSEALSEAVKTEFRLRQEMAALKGGSADERRLDRVPADAPRR